MDQRMGSSEGYFCIAMSFGIIVHGSFMLLLLPLLKESDRINLDGLLLNTKKGHIIYLAVYM